MAGDEVTNFKELLVWQLSHRLFLTVVADIETFPRTIVSKIIADQITKSVISIGTTIAEGFNSMTTRQYLYFLDIARRSAAESENWFHKLNDIRYIPEPTPMEKAGRCIELSKMLSGLTKSRKRSQAEKRQHNHLSAIIFHCPMPAL